MAALLANRVDRVRFALHSAATCLSREEQPVPVERIGIGDALETARFAQSEWQRRAVAARRVVLSKFRELALERLNDLASVSSSECRADSLASEVLPVLDACRFLEQEAAAILKPRRVGRRGRPMWLRGVSSEVRREPFGVVLVVAPSNYPLMLPGIQTLQALVAGNAVLWKPAAKCTAAANLFREILIEAGLAESLLQVLPETTDSVTESIAFGVDHVVLTGSVDTGRAVGRQLGDRVTSSTMELSGCDAAFVTASADIKRAVDCLAYGLLLNNSQTCIAPRRVFADDSVRDDLITQLVNLLTLPSRSKPEAPTAASISAAELIDEAVAAGATIVVDGVNRTSDEAFVASPTVLAGVSSTSAAC